MDTQEPKEPNYIKELRRYGGLGIDLVANTLVGFGLGYLLDLWIGFTKPWMMVAGVVLGSAAGFMTILRVLDNKNEKNEKDRGP